MGFGGIIREFWAEINEIPEVLQNTDDIFFFLKTVAVSV